MKRRYTVGVDFDGVLHQYNGDWQGADVIPGGPVDGAAEWLTETAKDYDIWINSTRCSTEAGCHAVREWLNDLDLGAAVLDVIDVGGTSKRPCLIYIDDRAYRFDGKNWPTPKQISQAKPWWRK